MHPQLMKRKLTVRSLGDLGARFAAHFLLSALIFVTCTVPARAQTDSESAAKAAPQAKEPVTDQTRVNAEGNNGATNAPQAQQARPAPTIASAVDREISNAENQIVEVAEAMPEDRFNFSPESLNISGSDYKGVRTFALEVKHIAASNYAIWSPLTGDKFPKDFIGGNGPENLKTKAEIIQFLKDSFALGHKAAATLTIENMLEPAEGSTSSRLRLAEFAVSHAYDHYGQMVEYLRMNGIVPPASRQKSD
jgi:hypothetical protein